jgi:creatinine amidohydrolase
MNQARSHYWQELTSPEFATLDPACTVAVLPVSAVEQHGPHLPLATDALINDALVQAALPRLASSASVLVLPQQSIGASLEHGEYPGTLSIEHETLLAGWLDIGRSVALAGLRKLVLLNTHGGNKALLDLAALKLRVELEMLVVRANYTSFGFPEGLFDGDEIRHGIHGGELETSLMLHIRPALVRREALQNFVGLPQELAAKGGLFGVEKPLGFGWMSQDLHPAGVCGNALAADAARGARYLDHLAERLAALLTEFAEVPLGIIGER